MNRGGQPGNNNGGSGKSWREALDKAVKQYTNTKAQSAKNGISVIKRGEALFKIATRVVEASLLGNKDAIQELGNRLDGKAHQSMDIGFHDDMPLEEMNLAELTKELAGVRKRIEADNKSRRSTAKSARIH